MKHKSTRRKCDLKKLSYGAEGLSKHENKEVIKKKAGIPDYIKNLNFCVVKKAKCSNNPQKNSKTKTKKNFNIYEGLLQINKLNLKTPKHN